MINELSQHLAGELKAIAGGAERMEVREGATLLYRIFISLKISDS